MGIGTNHWHVADGLRPHLLAGKALSTGSRRGSARCSCILLGVLKEILAHWATLVAWTLACASATSMRQSLFILAKGTIFENGLKLERFCECFFFACAEPEGGHGTM